MTQIPNDAVALVVEDDPHIAHLLKFMLERARYRVELARDGRAGQAYIQNHPPPAVALLDMMLPEISGMHVLHEIRGSPDTADLPVMMITGRSDPAGAVRALAAGADDVIAKPFAFEVLAARIERTLARASRIEGLKRSNLALDARIAARAMELGEARNELATTRADRTRLVASIQALHDEVERLSLTQLR